MENVFTIIKIDNHMVMIHVQVGKHTIDDVLLDGRDGMNIITKEFKSKLGRLKPKPTT
jgi:hypothetical protein